MPIVPDEARTFGMEGMFRQLGIFASEGQKYEPVDKDQVMFYREDKQGQILEEGINEAGAFSSWIAAATSYSHSNRVMVPFYIFYSMFGMQRIGDLAWAAADLRARGFLLGATAGRTTLNGEGLQHEDGHSHILSSVIPNCVSYDPTFGHEVAVIIQDGLRRMVTNQEDVYYYITLMNENYEHPADAARASRQGILKGMYLLQRVESEEQVARAADGLAAPSCAKWRPPRELLEKRLGRRRRRLERDQLHRAAARRPGRRALEPAASRRRSRACRTSTQMLQKQGRRARSSPRPTTSRPSPTRSAPSCRRAAPTSVLGTDGFGRSDSRAKLRQFFEVNRYFVAVAALKALADEGEVQGEGGRRGDQEIRHRSREGGSRRTV